MIHWELCKKFKFDHTNKWYIHNPEFVRPGKWDAQNSMGFWGTNGSSNLSKTTRTSDRQKRRKKKDKESAKLLTVSADHRVKLKEIEKTDEFLDLAWELKKKVEYDGDTNLIGAFEIKGRVETIQTIALLRSAWILKRILKTWGDFLSLRLQWETIS